MAMCSAQAALGQSYPSLTGTVETYFITEKGRRGFVDLLWWTELDLRLSSKWKAVGSYILFPGGHSFDEAYVSDDEDKFSFRAGRMRTAFGLNDWSDLFYNGFNQLPLLRQISLVDDLFLTREDSGVEATTHLGSVQIQAAAFDDALDRDQLLPNKIDHTTLRLQQEVGPFILGADFLTSFKGDQKIYGVDMRLTQPQLIVRGEAMWGQGFWPSSGYYLDASYRLPKLFRLQAVARVDGVKPWGESYETLYTIGAREIVNRYLSLNLNYSFGSLSSSSGYGNSAGSTGWSARAMFQYRF